MIAITANEESFLGQQRSDYVLNAYVEKGSMSQQSSSNNEYNGTISRW